MKERDKTETGGEPFFLKSGFSCVIQTQKLEGGREGEDSLLGMKTHVDCTFR